MSISDTLMRRSKEIVAEKKALLKKGDSSIQLAIGEGKDIMSVLRTSSNKYDFQYCLAEFFLTVKANMAVAEAEKMTEDEVIAQVTWVLASNTRNTALSR